MLSLQEATLQWQTYACYTMHNNVSLKVIVSLALSGTALLTLTHSLRFGVFLGRAKVACYWWVFVLLRPAAIFSLSMTRIEVKPLFYISFRYGPPNMVTASSHAQPQVYMKSSILFSKQVTKATSVKRHKATFLPRGGNFLGQRNIRIFSKCWLRSPCILGRT